MQVRKYKHDPVKSEKENLGLLGRCRIQVVWTFFVKMCRCGRGCVLNVQASELLTTRLNLERLLHIQWYTFPSTLVHLMELVHNICPRRSVLTIIVSAATSSAMVIHILDFPVTSTGLLGLFPSILVFVLLLMMINCFYGCARACSLDITAQNKIMEEPRFVFTCLESSLLRLS
jgi:hypothetical protein